MNYLTLSAIKMQSCIDNDFTDDDTLLESMGEAAEDYVEQLVNKPLDDITFDWILLLPIEDIEIPLSVLDSIELPLMFMLFLAFET